MAKFFNKLLDYIGIEETTDFDDEAYQEEFYEERDQVHDNVLPLNSKARGKRGAAPSAGVAAFPGMSQMKLIVYHPISYEDTQNIIDNLKSNKPVIVNMEDLDVDCAQRILDFIAGAVYALNATIFKISRGIFAVAPDNYDVIGNSDTQENGESL